MKNKNKKKNQVRILFVCITVTFLFMGVKKFNLFEKAQNLLNIRNLFSEENINYFCDKADDSLVDEYKLGYYAKNYEGKSLNKHQKELVNYIRYSKYKYIRKYLYRVGIFIAFLCLDVLFIFFWIAYLICCCKNCFLFNLSSPESQTMRFLFFVLSIILNILVIAFSITVLCLTNPFFKRANGIGCSTLTLVHHFKDGLGNSYSEVTNRWPGIYYLEQYLINSSNIYEDLMNTTKLQNDVISAISNFSLLQGQDSCGITPAFNMLMEAVNNFSSSSTNLSDIFNFEENFNMLRQSYQIYDDAENDVCMNIYDAYHDYINSHLKRLTFAIFSLTLIFSFLGIIILILYYMKKLNIFRIVYNIIWNICILLGILSIILSAIYGVVSYVAEDFIPVIHYILSLDNLGRDNPIFFETYNNFFAYMTDVCVNGDGNIVQAAANEEILKNFMLQNYQNAIVYNNTLIQLSQLSCSNPQEELARYSLINAYSELLSKISIILYLGSDLELSCAFGKNDKFLILKSLYSTYKRAIVLCAFAFLVGILLIISVLTGILFIYKYRYSDDNTAYIQNNSSFQNQIITNDVKILNKNS